MLWYNVYINRTGGNKVNIRIKTVSLEKAKKIDEVVTNMWDLFPSMYNLPEEIFGKELDAVVALERETIPWFCYYADDWYIPNVYVETVKEI